MLDHLPLFRVRPYPKPAEKAPSMTLVLRLMAATVSAIEGPKQSLPLRMQPPNCGGGGGGVSAPGCTAVGSLATASLSASGLGPAQAPKAKEKASRATSAGGGPLTPGGLKVPGESRWVSTESTCRRVFRTEASLGWLLSPTMTLGRMVTRNMATPYQWACTNDQISCMFPPLW